MLHYNGEKLVIFVHFSCHFSSRRKLGDEYHYIFECSKLTNGRKLYIDFVRRNRPNVIKYNNLMSSNSIYTLSKLCKLIRILNKRICPLGWSTSFHNSIFIYLCITCIYFLCILCKWSSLYLCKLSMRNKKLIYINKYIPE